MGVEWSQTSDEAENPNSNFPLPPPRVIESSGLAPVGSLARVLLPPPQPKDLSVKRKMLPFVIDSKSLSVKRQDSLLAFSFRYQSSSVIRATATIRLIEDLNASSADCVLQKTADVSACKRQPRDAVIEIHYPSAIVNPRAQNYNLQLLLTDGDDRATLDGHVSGDSLLVTGVNMYIKSDNLTMDLLHLFGSASSSGISEPSKDQLTCVICFSDLASVAFLPCRHVCACAECSRLTLKSSSNHCPICRSVVSGQIHMDQA